MAETKRQERRPLTQAFVLGAERLAREEAAKQPKPPKPPRPLTARQQRELEAEQLGVSTKDLKERDKPHAVRDPAVLEKVLNALQLRKGGASYRNIGKTIGVNEVTARNYVVEEMRRLSAEIQEEVVEHRQLQLERVNDMIMAYWPRRADPKYGAMIASLMQRQDQLLGMEAQKIDLNVTKSEFAHYSTEELEEFLAKKTAAFTKHKKLSEREE